MGELEERIAGNLARVRAAIASAAVRSGRRVEEVRLVAVTKGARVEEMRVLYALGVRHFGENRLESALEKIQALPDDIHWHMIAPIQRRKAREIVRQFQRADAVDRVAAAEALQKRCEELGKTLEVLVEVNVSAEPQKHGIAPEALSGLLDALGAFSALRVRGLMTMAPFDAPASVLRGVFGETRRLADVHGLAEVSMGMSGDFEIAIEEGATEVRVGSSLFQ